MIMTFKNNNVIQSFSVERGKVLTTIEIGNQSIINPSIDQFTSLGWEEYINADDQYIPTLEELVEKKIREKYSLNKELQIQRKKDTNPEQFQIYYDYVEHCIIQAREQINNEYPYGTN